jgi:hypothetical protein
MHESGSSVSAGGKGGFFTGRGTPAHKHASYDVYGSYESEGQALEILCGLIFSLLLFVGIIVIFWGPGFVTSNTYT